MAINVTIQPPDSTSVAVSGALPPTSLTLASGQLLENRFFQSSTAPTTNVSEGDLWYDLSLSKLNLRGESSWAGIGVSAEILDGDYFRFTSTALASGNLAEFKNDTTLSFSIGFDGVMKLTEQASVPTAVEGGIYYKDNELFIGVDR